MRLQRHRRGSKAARQLPVRQMQALGPKEALLTEAGNASRRGNLMGGNDRVMQMLFDLADPALQVLPKETGCDEGQLRQLWQRGWERACDESKGDLVKLADAVCEELRMLVVVALLEDEIH